MEGVLDLAETFGAVPNIIYVAALAYQTADGGILGSQAPAGNADSNVDPGEFLALPVAAIRDNAGNGTFDRLDPARAFCVQKVTRAANGATTLNWRVVPGRSYRIEYSSDLSAWQPLTDIVATSGQDIVPYTDAPPTSLTRRFYRLKLLP